MVLQSIAIRVDELLRTQYDEVGELEMRLLHFPRKYFESD